MRAKVMVVFGAAVLGMAGYVCSVWATPAAGFTSTTIALGRFGDIDAHNQAFLSPHNPANGMIGKLWMSMQKTKGPSDLYVQSNVWVPGGSSGWHTHPGHSLITVTAGEVTVYEGHGGECESRTYTAGQGFVDVGDGHVHLIRNEGPVDAKSITVQLLAAGAARRIDAPAPSVNCPL
jgi:quercetin dioxygenase-like cupin family protein